MEAGGKKEGKRLECTRAILGPRMCEEQRSVADHLPIT